jgi:hypothetical protein
MPFGKRAAEGGPRAYRRPPVRRGVEPLERRDLLTLTLQPLSYFTNVPFAGRVASFAPGDVSGTLPDFTASVTWGDGTTSQAGIVSDGANFDVLASKTYTSAGQFPLSVTVNGLSGTKATAAEGVTVSPQLVATGATITAQAGTLFSGPVATFTDSAQTPAGGFTAAVNWGDGSTTQGTIVPTGAGAYTVDGAHTYGTAGPFSVTVTVTRLAFAQQATASTAAVVNGALTAVPAQGVTATAGQPFSATLATVVDAQAGSNAPSPTNYTAKVFWGDGSSSPGALVTVTPTATGASPYVALVGTHTYPSAGRFTITVVVARVATGQTAVGTLAASAFSFSGTVDPLSAPTTVNGTVVTDHQEPILTGSAEPGATVRLWFSRVGGDLFPLGVTQADSTGRWSTTVGPIAGQPVLIYGQALPVSGPPTPVTLLVGGSPLFVTPHPVRVVRAVFGPAPGQMTVTVARADAKGPDPAGLSRASSYTLTGPDGRSVTPTSVRVAPANARRPTAPRAVTLTFPPSAAFRRGVSTLRVAFNGLVGDNGTARLLVRGRS